MEPEQKRKLVEDEPTPAHPHRILWAVTVLTLAGLIAAGAYGYWVIGSHGGKLNLLPAMQDQLVAAGRRISAAEDAVRSWTSEREAWAKRLNKVEARVDGALRAARKNAEEIAARTEQRVQAQLDERTTNLQAKVDRIQAAEQSVDTRLSSMQGQLNQMQAANEQEVERLREEVRQAREAGNATLADLDRQIARVDQRSDESRSDLESLHRRVDRERIGFEVAVNHDRELAPGVNLDVSHTDISHQRFDGWVWLMPDRRTIWIHGRGLAAAVGVLQPGRRPAARVGGDSRHEVLGGRVCAGAEGECAAGGPAVKGEGEEIPDENHAARRPVASRWIGIRRADFHRGHDWCSAAAPRGSSSASKPGPRFRVGRGLLVPGWTQLQVA